MECGKHYSLQLFYEKTKSQINVNVHCNNSGKWRVASAELCLNISVNMLNGICVCVCSGGVAFGVKTNFQLLYNCKY